MNPAPASSLAQQVLDNHPDGCLAVDSSWDVHYANRAAIRFLGSALDSYEGSDLWALCPEWSAGPPAAALERAMSDRVPATFQGRLGSRSLHVRAVPSGDGGLLLFLQATPIQELARREVAELEALYQTLPVGLAFLDTQLRYLRINELLAQINGLPVEAHIGRTIQEVIPEISPLLASDYRKVIATGQPMLNKSVFGPTSAEPGAIRSFVTDCRPARDAAGEVLGLTVVVRETTAQRLADESLRLQAGVLNNMAEGVSIADQNGLILYTNPAEDRMFGYDKGELPGRHVSTQIYGANHARTGEQILADLKSIGFWKGEIPSCRKDGSTFTALAHISALESSGQKYFVCVEEDITERKRALRALEESEERLSTLAELAPVIVWTARPDAEVDYFNSQWYRFTGQTTADSMGSGWQRAIHPLDLARLLEQCSCQAITGEIAEVEFRLRPPTGDFRWFLSRCVPLRGDDGAILRWFGTYSDIDDRKRAAETLRRLNQQLQTVIQSSPLPIVAFAADGNITLWNPAAAQTFGWTQAEVLGKPIPFIPEEKRQEHLAMRRRDLQGQCFTGLELRRNRKDGSPIDISVSTAPLVDETGAITGIMSMYIDITEQKRIQQALQGSEERYRFLAESLPQMVWTTDRAGHIDYCNQHWLDYTGLSLEQTREAGWRAALHPGEKERVALEAASAEAHGLSYKVECRLRRASDGAYRWHLVTEKPYLAAGRWKWLGTSIDIHDRIVAEELVREANLSLIRANDSLKQFAYAAAHDLQEPLRMVGLYSQLIGRQYKSKLDPEADEFLDILTDSALRMQNLVHDLLQYTQAAEADDQPAESVDVNEVMHAVVKNLQSAIRESGAVVRYEDLPVVPMQTSQLTQVLQNLVGNGLKYRSQAPPVIEIQVSRQGAGWLFSVRDNGIGIAPVYHERIFGVFKRLHRREYPGTGIGLAICARIVEKYGGRIWVESQEGQGATFYFTLRGA